LDQQGDRWASAQCEYPSGGPLHTWCCWSYDQDSDGYTPAQGDCNNWDNTIYPGKPLSQITNCCCVENIPNNQDENCDSFWDGYACFSYSPILIDLSGNGFNLTSYQAGVRFDINGDGVAEQLGWTSAAADDSWLALDRNANGIIDNGFELFGNFTTQPASVNPNGFAALAVFDAPQNGGNDNGWIDREDAVFSNLRLWRDSNHDGVSQASELRGLSAAGVQRISLDYRESRRIDEWSNIFRYRAKVEDTRGQHVGRWAYDVFLSHAIQ
jgi:hypothetical protein